MQIENWNSLGNMDENAIHPDKQGKRVCWTAAAG